MKTRRAGSNKQWNKETRIGLTELGNRVTSRQNLDPGEYPGRFGPGLLNSLLCVEVLFC